MIQQPSFDRCSQPGPYEKRYGVKVLLLMPECHICGQKAHPEFLQRWNGIIACKYCITDINEEAEQYEHYIDD